MQRQRQQGANYLFASIGKRPYSERGVRKSLVR